MDRRVQLGDLARSKRLANRQSIVNLAYETGVSMATITKIEKGLPVKDETLGKVLVRLQMLDALKLFRDEQLITENNFNVSSPIIFIVFRVICAT